jgi:hypothetical protein
VGEIIEPHYAFAYDFNFIDEHQIIFIDKKQTSEDY